jgi:hypothetical protein
MSAWVVDKGHIDVLVKAAENAKDFSSPFSWVDDNGRENALVGADARNKLGQALVDACVKSVSYRYPQDDVSKGELPGPIDAYYTEPYSYREPGFNPTPGEVFKAVDCYDYQSCEHPDYYESAVHKALQRVTAHYQSKVAGYEEAPWGFDADRIAARRAGVPA